MSLLEAQIVTPNSFVRVNSAGELVSDILVSSIATNAYVDNAIAALINLAPSSLDTLSEIATELNLKQYKILSGYTIGSAVAIANTDNVEQAFGKVQASINTNAASIATNAAAIVTINSTLGTVVYLGSSQSVTGIKSFTQVIKADGGLDVTATGGSDVLNIGTSNADVINIGWSGAQVVIQGSVFSNNVTNLEITDKLIRLNKGGSAASAISTGFEIEENAIVTGYFATNGTRDGYDFKAPGITDYVTFSLAALTAHRTLTAPDADGIIATQSYAVAKAGDTMTGPLYVNYSGNSSTIAGNSISVYHTSANRYLTLVADATTSIRYIDLASGFSTYLNFAGSLSATNNISVPIGSGTLALTSDLSAYQPLDSDLTTLAGLTPTTNNFIVSVAGAWASRTPAQVKTTLAIANTDVSGLGTLSTQSGTFSGTSSGTNTGDQDLSVKISTGSAASLSSLVLTGTAGAGYLQLLSQSSPPSAVSGNMIVYSNSSNSFSLVKRNAANSADITRTLSFPDSSVTYTYPGDSDTLAGLGTAQTFTADQSFTANIIPTVANTYSLGANSTTGDWATVYARIIKASDITGGTNQAGNSLTIQPGLGAGNATSSLIFRVAQTQASGSTPQVYVTAFTVLGNLNALFNNAVSAAANFTAPLFTSSVGMTIRPGATSGTDAAGNNLNINSGNGTSAGAASSIVLGTPTVLASGTTAQTSTTRATIDVNGVTVNSGSIYVNGIAGSNTILNYSFGSAAGTGSNYGIFCNTSSALMGLVAGGVTKLTIGATIALFANLAVGNQNLTFGTTTGGILGTATNQKISFWNATPIVQPTTAFAAATLVSNGGTALTSTDTIGGYTLLQVVNALRSIGLLA